MRVLKISYCVLVMLSLAIIVWYGFWGRYFFNRVPESEPIKEVAEIDYTLIRIDEPPKTEVEEIGVVEHEPVEVVAVEPEPIFHLTDEERSIVEKVVMGESGNEPYDGQVLVAQCLLNACLKDGIQPSEVRIKYKYAGWHENPTQSVKDAVSAVFDDGYTFTDEPILYFYAPKWCTSDWHETQVYVLTLGGHKFFKEHNDWR